MPLSFNKLETLLNNNGFIPKKIFVIGEFIVYIEVLVVKTADTFMLYIPSKYDIKNDTSIDVYNITPIDVDENGNITTDYAGDPDNFDLEKEYDDIDLDNKHTKGNIEEDLQEKYNHQVSLKDTNKDSISNLREVFRQLKRLRFCVQNLKYKLVITFSNYLCCIGRHNTFDCYSINNFTNKANDKKLTISIDLESLYSSVSSITIDIGTIREGIYRVLDKNQNKHIKSLQKMLEHKNDLTLLSEQITIKKAKYTRNLGNLDKLLTDLIVAEKKVVEKILTIQHKYNNGEASLKGLYVDIEKTHQITKLEEELARINAVKQELMSNILQTKEKYDNLCLKSDNICFDNIVMIDKILKNFNMLTED